MKRINDLLFIASLLIIGCKDPIPAPDPAVLISPEASVSCLYVPLSTATANVVFSWQEALNTDDYLLKVRNETSGIETSTPTENTSLRLTLDRGQIYGWKVVSRSEASAEESESETRYFFLEAQQQYSHLPFPAKLVAPEQDAVVQLNNGSVNFNWEGADLDNDISSYTLLIGASEDTLEEVATGLTGVNYSTSLAGGNQYYWQVITTDSEENQSSSLIFYFQTAP